MIYKHIRIFFCLFYPHSLPSSLSLSFPCSYFQARTLSLTAVTCVNMTWVLFPGTLATYQWCSHWRGAVVLGTISCQSPWVAIRECLEFLPYARWNGDWPSLTQVTTAETTASGVSQHSCTSSGSYILSAHLSWCSLSRERGQGIDRDVPCRDEHSIVRYSQHFDFGLIICLEDSTPTLFLLWRIL